MRLTFTLVVEATDDNRADKVVKRWSRFVKLTGGISGVAIVEASGKDPQNRGRPAS